MNWAYDLEVFKNCFTATFIDLASHNIDKYVEADINKDSTAKKIALSNIKHKIFVIFDDTNNIKAMYDFILSKDCEMLVGYNNHHYDDVILDYIIYSKLYNLNDTRYITNKLYELSQDILGYIGRYRKDNEIPYSRLYFSLDVMKLNYLDKLRISLKQVSITLKWYRVEDYTMPPITKEEADKYYNGSYPRLPSFDRYVCNHHLNDIIEYNINDVLMVIKLYYDTYEELVNRIAASKKYNLNLYSDSRSSMADKIISKLYMESTGLKFWDFATRRTFRRKIKFSDIIVEDVYFKTAKLQSFLNRLKDIVISVGTDKFEEVLLFKKTVYKFAKGGLHSVDNGHEYTNAKYQIIDADVGSFYPSIMGKYMVKPDHVASTFNLILQTLTDSRLKAKEVGDKSLADIFKIVINAIYGKTGFEASWLFDLKAMYKVTINGQLNLMMLIEALEMVNISVISANTDGIVVIVYPNQLEDYYTICKKWEEDTEFTLEYTEYKKYVRTTVNDYLAVKLDGQIKTKGDFVDTISITKGYYAPCIAKTLIEYYVNDNKDIDSIIKTYDIYDYLISVKVGKQFISEYHTIKDGNLNIKELQKNNRYFVSNKGGVFLKRNKETNKHINVIAKHTVTIFNNFYHADNYDINYNWYKSKVINIINKVNNSITTDMKKNIGNLFNEL